MKNSSHQRFPAFFRLLLVACFLAGGITPSFTPAQAVELTVFAAASLKDALDENVKAFSAKSGHQVRVSYAGSNALARQIDNGAPADVFISADEEWMNYVAGKNLIAAGSRRELLTNSLVLVAPANSSSTLRIASRFALAGELKGGRLALANPDFVPIGKYARAALTKLEVWSDVEKSLTRSENVRASLVLVARGEAPLGIVYASDAKVEPKVKVLDTFAASLHPPVVYPIAALTGKVNPASQALLNYLAGAEARTVWSRHGFGAAR